MPRHLPIRGKSISCRYIRAAQIIAEVELVETTTILCYDMKTVIRLLVAVFLCLHICLYVYYNVYKEVYMRTNIVLNDELVRLAFMCVPFIKTKKDLIETALREFVEVRKTKEIQDIRGMDLFDESYDYKAMRKGK